MDLKLNIPAAIRLMRLDKPIGIWLVLFPALWGVLMAKAGAPNLWLLVAMGIGAVAMRSAGCIVNDLADRDLDGAVERTRHRPLVTGEITQNQAYCLLGGCLLIALLLCAFLPLKALLYGMMVLPLIAAYPWMKRITWWPQLFLGLTFNFGVIIGWAATGAAFTNATWMLYAACIAWTLGYDTVYALQDMQDDALIGIRSTARRFEKHLPLFVAVCYVAMVCLLFLAGMFSKFHLFYMLGVAGVWMHSYWQISKLKSNPPATEAGRLFYSNQWLGVWLFFCMLLDRCV